MEQRPLRLGDIVDDYCTRERRITNHAVVAIVGDAIRQTRCTTCDSEHPYKGAKEPRLRKKSGSELYDQVLADVNGHPPDGPMVDGEPDGLLAAPEASEPADLDDAADGPPVDEPAHDHWPAHRRLIRATLPRSENEPPPPRPIPEFTMHQRPPTRAARGFRFRGQPSGHGGGNGNGNVSGNGNGPAGFGHGRPGRHRNKKRPR
jgi:hypothetical protein